MNPSPNKRKLSGSVSVRITAWRGAIGVTVGRHHPDPEHGHADGLPP